MTTNNKPLYLNLTADTVELITESIEYFAGKNFLNLSKQAAGTASSDNKLEEIQASLVKIYGEQYPALLARIVSVYVCEKGFENISIFKKLISENPKFNSAPKHLKTESILDLLLDDYSIDGDENNITVNIKNCPHHNSNYFKHPRLCPISLILLLLFKCFEKQEIRTAKRDTIVNGKCVINYKKYMECE